MCNKSKIGKINEFDLWKLFEEAYAKKKTTYRSAIMIISATKRIYKMPFLFVNSSIQSNLALAFLKGPAIFDSGMRIMQE